MVMGSFAMLVATSSSCASKSSSRSNDLDKRWREATEAFNARVNGTATSATKKIKSFSLLPQTKMYEWYGDELKGSISIDINLSEQTAYFKKGGVDAGWSYVATGIETHPTPTGSFRVTEKQKDKYSNLYGVIYDKEGNVVMEGARVGRDKIPLGGQFDGASMPYWMRLTSGGVGLHAGIIPHPGYPASHGCIRLPEDMAETLFSYVVVGTPVRIRGRAPY